MPKLSPDKQPSYRLHKRSGQAIVTLSGRDILLGTYGTKASRAEYDFVTGEWIANVRQPAAGAATDLTVSTLIVRFWTHAEGYYRNPGGTPGRELLNFKNALKPLRRLYGHTPAAAFGPLALKAVRQAMVKDFGWCRNVVKRQTARIRQRRRSVSAEATLPGQEVGPVGSLRGSQSTWSTA